jgi:transposase InsO family protein
MFSALGPSPNQNGKVERLHGTLRPGFLDEAELFESVEAAQAAVDAWVACYNADRPHQGLDVKVPVVPADRFVAAEPAEGVKLWLPATLEVRRFLAIVANHRCAC